MYSLRERRIAEPSSEARKAEPGGSVLTLLIFSLALTAVGRHLKLLLSSLMRSSFGNSHGAVIADSNGGLPR